jgi:rod shape-determining protein MreD
MRVGVWILAGWFLMQVFTALAWSMAWAHVWPDPVLIVVVYAALRREPSVLMFTAFVLGFLTGRQSLAPLGVHEFALCLTALSAHLVLGQVVGSGTAFFGVMSGFFVMLYHGLLYVLLAYMRGHVGFSSLATASLLPTALVTCVCAWCVHGVLRALDRAVTRERSEGLSWR